MNEAETRAELTDSASSAAGWDVVEASRVRREHLRQRRVLGRQRFELYRQSA